MKRWIVALCVYSCVFAFANAQLKVSILGDSYSTFSGYVTPAKNLCFYKPVSKFPNDVHDVKNTWWWILLHDMNYQLELNNSYSGSTICNTGYARNDYSDRSFVARMGNVGNPDVLFIFGGTNDCWANSPLGEYKYSNWTRADLYKFRPAFACMLSKLKKEHPKTRIVNICNSDLEGDYNASMAEICKHYNVENVQLENIDKQYNHPSIAGMKAIAKQVEKVMKKAEGEEKTK